MKKIFEFIIQVQKDYSQNNQNDHYRRGNLHYTEEELQG